VLTPAVSQIVLSHRLEKRGEDTRAAVEGWARAFSRCTYNRCATYRGAKPQPFTIGKFIREAKGLTSRG